MKIQPKKGTKKVIHRESIPKRKIPKFTTAFAAFILLHLLLLENFKELEYQEIRFFWPRVFKKNRRELLGLDQQAV